MSKDQDTDDFPLKRLEMYKIDPVDLFHAQGQWESVPEEPHSNDVFSDFSSQEVINAVHCAVLA
ncbi:MAG TPA: hypothetical protein ACQGQH_08290 [Xylella sp.]